MWVEAALGDKKGLREGSCSWFLGYGGKKQKLPARLPDWGIIHAHCLASTESKPHPAVFPFLYCPPPPRSHTYSLSLSD